MKFNDFQTSNPNHDHNTTSFIYINQSKRPISDKSSQNSSMVTTNPPSPKNPEKKNIKKTKNLF